VPRRGRAESGAIDAERLLEGRDVTHGVGAADAVVQRDAVAGDLLQVEVVFHDLDPPELRCDLRRDARDGGPLAEFGEAALGVRPPPHPLGGVDTATVDVTLDVNVGVPGRSLGRGRRREAETDSREGHQAQHQEAVPCVADQRYFPSS